MKTFHGSGFCGRVWVSTALLLALGCERDAGASPRRAKDASADRDAAKDAGQADADAESGKDASASDPPPDAAAADSGVPSEDRDPKDAGHVDDLPADPMHYIMGGQAYAPLQSKQGVWVLLTRGSRPESKFQLHAESLPAPGQYRASVHRLPCDAAEGGERYRIDPTQPYDGPNILSHTFSVGVERSADETWTVPHPARQDAQSLVVEGPLPGTARVACADLEPTPDAAHDFRGPFQPFRDADDTDREINGMGSLGSGAIELRLQGLRAERQYLAVLYALPCRYALAPAIETGLDAMDQQAYRVDPTAAALGANAIQLVLDATGYARRSDTYVRFDAQSLVLFRNPALAIACADLTHVGAYPDFDTHNYGGEPYPVRVFLTRSRTQTKLEASLSFIGGPQARATFTLLRTSCSTVAADRAPYLINPAGSADSGANRIELEAFGDGQVRSTTAKHVARVEAHSVLVLTPSYPPRCLDLF